LLGNIAFLSPLHNCVATQGNHCELFGFHTLLFCAVASADNPRSVGAL
jgi:hypothetical protein